MRPSPSLPTVQKSGRSADGVCAGTADHQFAGVGSPAFEKPLGVSKGAKSKGFPPGVHTTTLSESRSSAVPGGSGVTAAPDKGPEGPPTSRDQLPLPGRPRRYVEACKAGRWHINLTRVNGQTGEIVKEWRQVYKCKSWRHPGECARWRAAQNFSRIAAALDPLQRRHVVFIVLTLDRKKWRDRYHAFEDMKEKWRSLRKAITRRWGANSYVSTVEVQKAGWPHLNVVMHCPLLAEVAGGHSKRAEAWIKKHAGRCGFGHQAQVTQAKSKRKLAGYVVKIAGRVERGVEGQTVGEAIKLSQVPHEAPRHFRRLRSSVKFLQPPHASDENTTGELLKYAIPTEAKNDGSFDPEAVPPPPASEVFSGPELPVEPYQFEMPGGG